ncbi:Metallo-dependent phosphatase-like protein [Limtongia smithiae]|uniref:Metallo-dependent phosphatase-like protein n=1 Tax=Limtongia smithiae TaxID=1125753 RepID=UPI0034D01729
MTRPDPDASPRIPDLRIVHFNDVYHIAPQLPDAPFPGGAARFVTLVNEYRSGEAYDDAPDLLTVFSGDCLSPSLESTITRGEHMIPILGADHIGVDVAVYGNHEFDFGADHLAALRPQFDFPWTIANLLINDKPVAGAEEYVIRDVDGVRVGFIGLVESEWLDTINVLPTGLVYRPFIDVANELAPRLRTEHACDLVVAITHMREPNDLKLASSVPPGTLDLVLGGHDHFYSHKIAGGVDVLCSGTDFRNLSYIEGFRTEHLGARATWEWKITRRDLTRDIPEDARTRELVDSISGELNKQLDKVIGYSDVPLDARFETVRSAESNLGNFVADIIRVWYDADIALVAGGTLRSDTLYNAGPIRMKDIVLTFPFEDPCVVISITGKELLAALENSVSKLPALEGRFLQVSGLKYSYSLKTHPRIRTVTVDDKPLDLLKTYTCATRGYMLHGKDGFTSLHVPPEKQVVDEEQGMLLMQMLRTWFLSRRLLVKWKDSAAEHSEHVNNTTLTEKHGARHLITRLKSVQLKEMDLAIERKVLDTWTSTNPLKLHGLDEDERGGISPGVEGRITRID